MKPTMPPPRLLWICAWLTCAAQGCGQGSPTPRPEPAIPGPPALAEEPSLPPYTPPSGTVAVPICAEMGLAAVEVPSEVLLLVDVSASMDRDVSYRVPESKIAVTRKALQGLIAGQTEMRRFGMMQFPSDAGCGAGRVLIPFADSNQESLGKAIEALAPDGATPTGEALALIEQASQAEGPLFSPGHSRYVALLTDGLPTCPTGGGKKVTEEDKALALSKVRALRALGVETFVIGLGDDVNQSDPGFLGRLAEAGGRPRPDGRKYYRADDLPGLQAILQEIETVVMACEVTLDPKPPFPRHLWVSFDGQKVARDPAHLDGWDYDEATNQLELYGNLCLRAQNSAFQRLEIKMGCRPED